jgi:hypothetical protein
MFNVNSHSSIGPFSTQLIHKKTNINFFFSREIQLNSFLKLKFVYGEHANKIEILVSFVFIDLMIKVKLR